jgi:RHS repeat-associated protein
MDVENRMVGDNVNTNFYDHAGKRVLRRYDPYGWPNYQYGAQNTWEFAMYGLGGQRILTVNCVYGSDGGPNCGTSSKNVYWAGKLVVSRGVTVATDRLGSVRANSNGESFAYYPYGEERTTTADGREKFGSYARDNTSSDYADQRYYNVGMGRFNVPDPLGLRGVRVRKPVSWNRFAYAWGDPINHTDRHGLNVDADPTDGGCWWDAENEILRCSVTGSGGGGGGNDGGEGGGGETCDENPFLASCLGPPPPFVDPDLDPDPANSLPPCPPMVTPPPGISNGQIQQNINIAHAVTSAARGLRPLSLEIDAAFLTVMFWKGGPWDYKKEYNNTPYYDQAKDFGNFDFGAVMASLGLNYYLTQNAAGTAQIAICLTGGNCDGTGIPLFTYPYGDQASDAAVIKQGFDWERAKLAGCKDN